MYEKKRLRQSPIAKYFKGKTRVPAEASQLKSHIRLPWDEAASKHSTSPEQMWSAYLDKPPVPQAYPLSHYYVYLSSLAGGLLLDNMILKIRRWPSFRPYERPRLSECLNGEEVMILAEMRGGMRNSMKFWGIQSYYVKDWFRNFIYLFIYFIESKVFGVERKAVGPVGKSWSSCSRRRTSSRRPKAKPLGTQDGWINDL